MKKKILSIALVVAMVAVIAAGSLAYFTDKDSADNVFTVGNVNITLTEPNWDSTGKEDAPEVYAGEPLAKDPTVTNDGNNPCFVRIKVENLDQFGNKGAITYRTDYVADKLGDGWEKVGDYFYYNKVLEVGATTDALFDQIVMPTGLTGDEEAAPIKVTAEAVQAQGAKAKWADVQNMTVADIAAWFDTCMAG
ncbi:MAG: TasA family protein [Oscillospiraceae bacterium]